MPTGWLSAASPLGRVPLIDQFTLRPPDTVPASLLDLYRLVYADPGLLQTVVNCTVVNCTDPASTMRTAFESRATPPACPMASGPPQPWATCCTRSSL